MALFLVKNVFVLLVFLFQILTVICITLTSRKNTDMNLALSHFLVSVLLSLFFFVSTLLIRNETQVMLFQSAYFASLDWFLLFFLEYVMALAGRPIKPSKSAKVFRIIYVVLATADTLLLMFNYCSKIAFSMQANYVRGVFYCWICEFHFYYYIHLFICYLVIFVILGEICYRIFTISKMYKFKYIFILIVFIVVLVMNVIFMVFMKIVRIDYSVLVFACLSVLLYVFSQYRIPQRMHTEILLMISQNISNPVICYNQEGQCIYKNKKAEEICRNPELEKWCSELQAKDLDISVRKEILQIYNNDGVLEDHVFNVEFKRIYSKNRKVLGSFISFEDRTIEKINMEREERRARYDALTGFYNRTYFFEQVEKTLKATPDVPRYMVCTNIRKFKMINEMFGAKFGDSLIVNQAELLKRAEINGAMCGRISGDRFAMLIEKSKFNSNLAIKNTNELNKLTADKNYHLHVSIGVYEIVNPYENVNTMYDKAIMALNEIKDDYSRMVSFYSSEIMSRILDEKNIINEFQQALEANQIIMYLQAQVDAKTEKCIGAEALARWQHVDRGLLNPASFVGILEETGLVYKLDYFIWKKAVQKLAEWQNNGHPELTISVNISPKDFYYADIYTDMTELVRMYQINPARLHLEITENALIDKDFHNAILRKLSDFGFKIEMDDFGSGYSSFMSLKDLKMDHLKIDMEFLRETENNIRSQKMMISIIKMAKNLGMSVITEGVETRKNVDFLRKNGCDIFQGYYFSRPVPVSEFEDKFLEAPDA